MPTAARAKQIFREERARFAQPFPDALGVAFKVRTRHYLCAKCTKPRDLAWYDPNLRTVFLTKRALTYSEGTVRGLIRHELGHAVDWSDAPGAERRADRLAEAATGCPVRYTADGIQHATHGVPRRPDYLHQ